MPRKLRRGFQVATAPSRAVLKPDVQPAVRQEAAAATASAIAPLQRAAADMVLQLIDEEGESCELRW